MTAANENGENGTALIYCRVSGGPQAAQDRFSLPEQERLCSEHAVSLGYTVSQVFHEVYTGEEIYDRPELNKLRAALQTGQYRAFIFLCIDRLTRKQGLTALLLDQADRQNCRLISAQEGPIENTATGKFLANAREFAAELEREKIKERTLRAKRARVASGKLLSAGVDLYGYRRNKELGVREVEEPEAAIVRQIFTWYTSESIGVRDIARRLNVSTPAPSTGKIDAGDAPRWHASTIRRILRNAAYKGETTAWTTRSTRRQQQTRERPLVEHIRLPEGVTPAIVSNDVWDAAQARLASNKGASTRNASRPYLLRGLITCSVCGRSMYPIGERGGRRTYRCSSREQPGGPCGGKRIRADDVANSRPRDGGHRFSRVDKSTLDQSELQPGIDSWVWEHVERVLRNPDVIASELAARREKGADALLVSDLDAAKRALAKVERGQQRLLTLFSAADAEMPLDLLKQQLAATQREKQTWQDTVRDLERRLAAHQRAVDTLDGLTEYCERVAKNLERFGFEEKRIALEALGVRVMGSGREWRVDFCIPTESDAAALSHTSTCAPRRPLPVSRRA
jgi:site-specific DNA recombinase